MAIAYANEWAGNGGMMDNYRNFKSFVNQLTPEEVLEGNEYIQKKTEEQYNEFKKAFNNNKCSYCNKKLDDINSNLLCFHWLLNPIKLNKQSIPLIINQYGFGRVDAYLRWVANLEKPFMNINDLKSENSGKNIVEQTISFKNIEWSFKSSVNDFQGQPNSKMGKSPHFHLQIKVNEMVVVKFNDFHLPLSQEDVFTLKSKNDPEINMNHKYGYGEGMEFISQEELILDVLRNTENCENEALFHYQTMVTPKDGTPIPKEVVNKLMKEAQEKNVTMTSLLEKLDNVNVKTIVTPGGGVVKQSHRSKRKKRKGN
jgi:hypothetical protein